MVHLGATAVGGKREVDRIDIPQTPPDFEREYLPLNHPKYQGIGDAKGYAQGEEYKGHRITKVRYSHESMVDYILANPRAKTAEIGAQFGYSPNWVCTVIGSDAFQAYLAKRRDDIQDPFLLASIEERLRGLAYQSLDIITEKLQATQNLDAAIKALDMSTKALGFGARERGGGGNIQNNFVVQIPGQAKDSAEWAQAYTPISVSPSQPAIPVSPISTTVTRDPTIQPRSLQISED